MAAIKLEGCESKQIAQIPSKNQSKCYAKGVAAALYQFLTFKWYYKAAKEITPHVLNEKIGKLLIEIIQVLLMKQLVIFESLLVQSPLQRLDSFK